MRIAYVSFEYPPDNARGGIATYVAQAARLMAARGHQVEVFAATPDAPRPEIRDGVRINRCQEPLSNQFRDTILPLFAERHGASPFDVVEGPEYNADAARIKDRFPQLPLVVKMHTPNLILGRIGGVYPPSLAAYLRHLAGQMRILLGAWRQGRMPVDWRPFATWWRRTDDLERAHAQSAEIVACPCRDLMRYAAQKWRIPSTRVRHVPYPYIATPEFLAIPVETQTGRIGFFGRLELRKGVLDLAAAAPVVLEACPGAKFRFVGRPMLFPDGKRADDLVRERMGRAATAAEFRGAVPLDSIPHELAEVDICAFPSIWENFPNVCLEAMAAGRAIVASNAGGMSEMLAGGAGVLVPPRDPKALARAIIGLAQDPMARHEFGRRARARLLEQYSAERIGTLMEKTYQEACALTGS